VSLWIMIVSLIKLTKEVNILSYSLNSDAFSDSYSSKLVLRHSRESLNDPIFIVEVLALKPLIMLLKKLK